MKTIIEWVFKNSKNKTDIKTLKSDILDRIDNYKYSNDFVKEFMSLYDKEQLYKIMVIIQREINKRTIDELNNQDTRLY